MKFINFITPEKLMKFMRFWPPYLAAGIRVTHLNKEMTHLRAEMVQRPWNTNYVGSHFGGSLYAMCDPFYMFILLEHLKEEHIVWDKAAAIEFVRPGKGTVSADFIIPLEEIEKIRQQAKENYKVEPRYSVEVLDKDGKIVARVEKTLYVRRKDAVKFVKVPKA